MTDELTPDEIRSALRDALGDDAGLEVVRRLRDATPGHDAELLRLGFDRDAWQVLAEQLGLAAMGTPEAFGGLGLGLPAIVAAVEECGTQLVPGPVRATALLSWALRGLTPDPASELAPALDAFLTGEAIVGATLSAAPEDLASYDGGLVTGRMVAVTHGGCARLVVAPVRTAEGTAVAVLLVGPETTRADALPTVDPTLPMADLAVDAAPAALLTAPGDKDALALHLSVARLLLAAEQVGGAQGCLAGMVGHAMVRSQFGQLIGSYQAIQHHCATTAIDIASARSLVTASAAAIDADDQVAARQLGLLARAEAADCFHRATRTLIQVAGGIGFTWEHDAHLYFRRARATASLAGTPDVHRHAAVEAGCLDLLLAAS